MFELVTNQIVRVRARVPVCLYAIYPVVQDFHIRPARSLWFHLIIMKMCFKCSLMIVVLW